MLYKKNSAQSIIKILKRNMSAWLYLSPFMIIYILFMIYPVGRGLILSLYSKTLFTGYKFVGLHNYAFILSDPTFIQDLSNVFYFTVVTVLIYTFLSLIIAVLFNRKGKITYVMRSFIVAPMVLSVSVIGIIWQLTFTVGPGNTLIQMIFGKGISISTNSQFAMWVIIIATLWWTLGADVIIFLAGLQSIPLEYYESAKIDGASSIRMFFSITIPLLKPIIIVVIILQTIASFQLFGQPYTMTGGGPFNSTATPLMYIYNYLNSNIGIASSASILLFALMMVVSIIEIFLISKGKESGQ